MEFIYLRQKQADTVFLLSIFHLISGSKKPEAASESQPAASPWAGSSLSGCRRAADKPKPLWRPVGEEEEEVQASSSSKETSESKPPQGDACPPSPRTLEAIQAALNDGSDDDEEEDKKDGGVSPRTRLAIQQALTEEEDAKPKSPPRPAVVSVWDEESRPFPEESSDFPNNAAAQSVHIDDSLLDSSSEEELEEVVEQRNKAFRLAAQAEEEEEEERTREAEEKEELKEKASNQNSSTVGPSPQTPGNPEKNTEERNGDEVKTKSVEDSGSEGKTIIMTSNLVRAGAGLEVGLG